MSACFAPLVAWMLVVGRIVVVVMVAEEAQPGVLLTVT
jgi:hypothetical protein